MKYLVILFIILLFSCSKETDLQKTERIINFYKLKDAETKYEASAITILNNHVIVAGWARRNHFTVDYDGIFILNDSSVSYIDSSDILSLDLSLKEKKLLESTIWFNDKFLISYNGNRNSRVNWNISSLENKRKASQYKTDVYGNLWEAAEKGLIKYNNEGATVYFEGTTFWGICFDKSNNLYASTLPKMEQKGIILKYDFNSWDTLAICSANAKWVPSMCFDSFGNLWFGVLSRWSVGEDSGDGLFKIDNSSITNYNIWNSGLSSNSVVDIDIDKYDTKWIGTYSGGLVKFGNNGKWQIFNPENSGIGHSTVDYIYNDNNYVWFSVEFYGLSRLEQYQSN